MTSKRGWLIITTLPGAGCLTEIKNWEIVQCDFNRDNPLKNTGLDNVDDNIDE